MNNFNNKNFEKEMIFLKMVLGISYFNIFNDYINYNVKHSNEGY